MFISNFMVFFSYPSTTPLSSTSTSLPWQGLALTDTLSHIRVLSLSPFFGTPLLLPASLIKHMLLGWAVHSHQPFLASATTHYTLLIVLHGFMGGRAVPFLLTRSSSHHLSLHLSPALHPKFPLILTLCVMASVLGVFGFVAVLLFAQGRGVHSGQ